MSRPQPSPCRSRPESARAQGEKVDTVEFAIAPHPEEPEEARARPDPRGGARHRRDAVPGCLRPV